MAKNPFLGKFQIQVQTGIFVRIHMIHMGVRQAKISGLIRQDLEIEPEIFAQKIILESNSLDRIPP